MPLEFESGTVVTIAPPDIPTLRAVLPNSPSVLVVPVPGPPGPVGGEAYQFSQDIPATVWTINHNLGRYPTVQLYTLDLSANYSEYLVQHLDVNNLRISIETPTAGIAFLV